MKLVASCTLIFFAHGAYGTYQIQDAPFTITSIRKTNSSGSIKTFRLKPHARTKLPFNYHPGDHIEFLSQDQSGMPLTRHFSLSSSPTDSYKWLEITTKYEARGCASELLHKDSKIGDLFVLRGPLDDGVRVSEDDPLDCPLVLISGGIGITPMIGITRYMLAKKWPGPIYFIHTSRTPTEMAFYDELLQYQQNHKNFYLTISMTRSDTTWKGLTGRIDAAKLAHISDIQRAQMYICGTSAMCTQLSTILQTAYQVPKSKIHQLSFGSIERPLNRYKTYTRDDLAQHTKPDNAWIALDGIVYDITKYINHHPGLDIITDYLGHDATEPFNAIPHSAQAKKLLRESNLITIKGVLN